MSCLFVDIPDFNYEKCVYWIEDGCKDNDPNCGNGDALCNETIECVRQLEAAIKKAINEIPISTWSRIKRILQEGLEKK